MSELAFELRFVIDITELSIYLCLVLGSQNHSEIRQQTRFWRGNSQWQIARCKMPFQSGLWTRWSKNRWWIAMNTSSDSGLKPPGVLTHSPIMIIPHLRTQRQTWRCWLMRFRCNWCWGRWVMTCHDPILIHEVALSIATWQGIPKFWQFTSYNWL